MLELLKVDEEFQGKIPPLTDEEFKQLEQNILADGEVNTPLVVWNGTIIDGHNRWKIIQAHPEIPYKVKEMTFKDKWEAFDWMYTNQLGRRNLTETQRTFLIGKLFEARKHTHGGNRGNQYTEVAKRKNCVLPNDTKDNHENKTAKNIAKEFGVSPRTVDAAFAYSKGIDAIKKEDPNLADDILTGKISVTHKAVESIRNIDQPEIKSTIKAIKDGTFRKCPTKKTEEEKKELNDIARRAEQSRTVSTYTPEIKDLVRDLKNNSAPYIRLLNQMISGYKGVIKGNSEIVLNTIKECIEDEIEKIKEKITNEYA